MWLSFHAQLAAAGVNQFSDLFEQVGIAGVAGSNKGGGEEKGKERQSTGRPGRGFKNNNTYVIAVMDRKESGSK